MPEKRVKVNVPGMGLVDGTEVQIIESVDRWTDVKLNDGTTLRLKPVVMSVVRIEGRYDDSGNPMYAVQAGQAMTADAPEILRQKPGQSPSKEVH